jgi:hypothetical protein
MILGDFYHGRLPTLAVQILTVQILAGNHCTGPDRPVKRGVTRSSMLKDKREPRGLPGGLDLAGPLQSPMPSRH